MMDTDSTSIADLPPTLRVEHAGRILGLGRVQSYEAVKRGDIPSVRVGRRILVPSAALIRRFNLDGADTASSV